jgi:hypothetical protein
MMRRGRVRFGCAEQYDAINLVALAEPPAFFLDVT